MLSYLVYYISDTSGDILIRSENLVIFIHPPAYLTIKIKYEMIVTKSLTILNFFFPWVLSTYHGQFLSNKKVKR